MKIDALPSFTLRRFLRSNDLAGGLIVHNEVDSLGKIALVKSVRSTSL